MHYNVHRQVHVLRSWKRWWLEVPPPPSLFMDIPSIRHITSLHICHNTVTLLDTYHCHLVVSSTI